MSIKLITGLKTTADIQSEDDGARIYGTISTGDIVLDVGEKFNYEIKSNNCVRIKSGEIIMQGRHIRQEPSTYTDLTIENGTQGQKRNDIIVLRYTKSSDTEVENAELAVIEGMPSESATDPAITEGDIFGGDLIHEMALYRVSINGLNISSVTKMFRIMPKYDGHTHSAGEIEIGTLAISQGGTGATTASEALINLGGASTKTYSTTLTTTWTGSSAPYTQTIAITGITSTDTPIVDVVLSSTRSTAIKQLEAWGCVSKIETGTNQITATCLEEKPTTAIPIQIKVVR